MDTFRKAVAAGLVISICATVYVVTENKIAGAILFSVGLLMVCLFGMNLFTGKIGYVFANKNKPNIFIIWLGNLVGTFGGSIIIRLAKPDIVETAHKMVEKKLSLNFFSLMVLSFFCGILMYVAVEAYRRYQATFAGIIGIFFCVPVFILCGFEHCIADMCYFVYGVTNVTEGLQGLLLIVIASVFNGVGAIVIRLLTKDLQLKKPQ